MCAKGAKGCQRRSLTFNLNLRILQLQEILLSAMSRFDLDIKILKTKKGGQMSNTRCLTSCLTFGKLGICWENRSERQRCKRSPAPSFALVLWRKYGILLTLQVTMYTCGQSAGN